jgi:hypothetical protein
MAARWASAGAAFGGAVPESKQSRGLQADLLRQCHAAHGKTYGNH